MICFLWGLGFSGLGRLGFSGFTGYYMGDSVGHVGGCSDLGISPTLNKWTLGLFRDNLRFLVWL